MSTQCESLPRRLGLDFHLVKEIQGTMESLKKLNEMDVDILLVSGSKSLVI